MDFRARLSVARVNNAPVVFTGPPAVSPEGAEERARAAADHLPDVLYDIADTDVDLVDVVDAASEVAGREPRAESLAGTVVALGEEPALVGCSVGELIEEWNVAHPHTRAIGGKASLAAYERGPLRLEVSSWGYERLTLGQSTAKPPAGEGEGLVEEFVKRLAHLERLERERATIEPMSAGELRARRELMGLSREDIGAVLAHVEGSGRVVAPRTIQDWEAEEATIPRPVGRTVRRMSAITAEAVDQVAARLRRDPEEPVAVYFNDGEFWREHPKLRPWPARWWRQVCGRALDMSPGSRLDYT